MGEIEVESSSNSDGVLNKSVEISLKTIGPSLPSRLSVPSPIKDDDSGGDVLLQLKNGDSFIVAMKPKPPPKHVHEGLSDDDDDDDDLKFQLPQSTSRFKRRLFLMLRHDLKLPEIILMAIFSLSLKMWIVIVMWFVLAPVAQRFELGPIYVLGTGFGIIFYNLGRRKPGEVSAYSIFNEDFRELPGTLNADRIDRDIRAGQF